MLNVIVISEVVAIQIRSRSFIHRLIRKLSQLIKAICDITGFIETAQQLSWHKIMYSE